MNLDTSKFKKIESNDKHTILEHPSGHHIKIAHSGLSEAMKKELEGLPLHLAKGGKAGWAKYAQKYDPNQNAKASKPSQVTGPAAGPTNLVPKEASKSYTEPNAMGTSIPKAQLKSEMQSKQMPDVVLNALNKKAPPFGPMSAEASHHFPPCINPSCKSYGHSHPNCQCYGGKFAEGGEIESFCSSKEPHQKECQYYAEGTGNVQPIPEPGPTPEEAPVAPVAQAPQTFNMTAPENLQQPQDINPNPEVQAKEQPEEAEAENTKEPANQMQQFQQHKDKASQELFPEAQSFKSDLDNGHITPETYQSLFHDKSTLGKVGTIFGLLLGGGGSALAGQPNALLGMMSKQIDNDLSAQQNSVTNKQNFLKINQQNLMNQANIKNIDADTRTKAYALSKAQMNYAALHKLVSDTQKLPEGPQKQQAMQTLAMMNQGVQNENFNILDRAASGAAFYKTLFGNQSGAPQQGEQSFQQKVGGIKMLGPQGEKRAEDMEQKHFPGVPGQASAPLSGGDREEIGSGLEFDKQLHNYMDWAKGHSGDLNPKDMAYGKSLAAGVQGTYRQATKGGVYKEGEQNFISKIIDEDPAKFFNSIRVLPKVQAVADQHQIRMDQLLKNKGFEGYKGYQGGQKQASSEQFKTVNGVKYKRGPNGEAIKVQ